MADRFWGIFGEKYSRVAQIKFVEDSLVEDHITLIFLKTVFHKFYFVHS